MLVILDILKRKLGKLILMVRFFNLIYGINKKFLEFYLVESEIFVIIIIGIVN